MPSRIRLTYGPHAGAVVVHPDDVPPVLLHLARHPLGLAIVPDPDDPDVDPLRDVPDVDAYARSVDEPDETAEWPYAPLDRAVGATPTAEALTTPPDPARTAPEVAPAAVRERARAEAEKRYGTSTTRDDVLERRAAFTSGYLARHEAVSATLHDHDDTAWLGKVALDARSRYEHDPRAGWDDYEDGEAHHVHAAIVAAILGAEDAPSAAVNDATPSMAGALTAILARVPGWRARFDGDGPADVAVQAICDVIEADATAHLAEGERT